MQSIFTVSRHILTGRKHCDILKQKFMQTSKQCFRQRQPVDKNGVKLVPRTYFDAPPGQRLIPVLLKCSIFTAGFCGTVYISAFIWHFEKIQRKYATNSVANWVTREWSKIEGWEYKAGNIRKTVNKWWNSLPEGRKIFWGICAINIMVFACWRHPALNGFMLQYFCTSPAAKAVCWPMLLATFSHYTPLHLFINMYVLHSFSHAVCNSLGSEQFLAFYLSAGVVSSLGSQIAKVATLSLGPSLGASGAIMALLGFFCTQNPDAQLGIVFLPQFPFSAEVAIKAVLCLDAAGLIFRWKLFDHAAHLAGALLGILYAKIGQSHIWSKQDIITEKWQTFSCKYISKKSDK